MQSDSGRRGLDIRLKALGQRQEQIETFRKQLAQHRQDLERVRDGSVDLENPTSPSAQELTALGGEMARSEA